jgi:hypothetical protein
MQSVQDAGVIHHSVLSIPAFMLMVDALRCMRNAAVSVAQPVSAIAVVEADHDTFPDAEEPMMVQVRTLYKVSSLESFPCRFAWLVKTFMLVVDILAKACQCAQPWL